MKKVAVIMGSASDWGVAGKAVETLDAFGVPNEVHVYSAHRTPGEARSFAAAARSSGFGVIIAAAGMAAHLPVIGIPIKSHTLDGVDALLSTVQMPSGIPVATVAVDGAVNAALLSIQILAVEDPALAEKLEEKRRKDAEKVLAADKEINARLGR